MKNKKTIALLFICFVFISFAFKGSPFFEIAKQIEIYNNLFKELNINYIYEINPGEFTNKAIKNTLKDLDPYTNFYNEQDVEDAKIRRQGEYGGLGISAHYTSKGIIVNDVYQGFSADKAGLKTGDVIIKVNNQDLIGLEKAQLTIMLKGAIGKTLNLKVKRQEKEMSISLPLDKVIINPVPFYDMIDQQTGYIVLTRFNAKASTEVKKAFINLKERGMQKLVFDLRYNPGGSLFESINIVNFFTPKGSKVVETRGKTKQNSRTYSGNKVPLDLEIPIAVLINRRSASASEIVSGALQDYDRAVIIGERSFGKGLVQRYFKLNYGTQLKATISKYYTPSGRCIQELDYENRNKKTGVVPKFSEGTTNHFKTKNGRTVYDGGGVLPDIKMEYATQTEATKKLLKSRAIFNFVTTFVYKTPSINPTNFIFSKAHFNQFKNYLLQQDTTFVTQQEMMFKKAYATVNKNEKIASEYQQIQQKLKEQKILKIAKNEKRISEIIQDEIIKRLAYKKGVYQHHLTHNETVKKAVNVLQNLDQYRAILAK